jgi:hypothetical protein
LDNFQKENQIKLNKNSKDLTKEKNKNIPKLELHFDALDKGTQAFMHWLGSDNKTSTSKNPIILSNSNPINMPSSMITPLVKML